jgi:hypothetical protein
LRGISFVDNSCENKNKGDCMKMRFTLTMDDLLVNGTKIDNMIIDWIDDVSQEEVLEMSQQWITSQNFLTERMVGLKRVGESSLTIEPVEEA